VSFKIHVKYSSWAFKIHVTCNLYKECNHDIRFLKSSSLDHLIIFSWCMSKLFFEQIYRSYPDVGPNWMIAFLIPMQKVLRCASRHMGWINFRKEWINGAVETKIWSFGFIFFSTEEAFRPKLMIKAVDNVFYFNSMLNLKNVLHWWHLKKI